MLAMPKSLKLVRALLVILAVLTVLNTLVRVGVVQQYGAAGSMPQFAGVALLAGMGAAFFSVCGGGYFLLGVPEKFHWWLMLLLPVTAAVNIAIAILVLPAEHMVVWNVIDVYLCNGILVIVATWLLLKRAVRVYFGVSRPPSRAKAA